MSNVAPLKVANGDFMVASTIERCPKAMMLRELFRNAEEAATRAPSGKKIVFRKVSVRGLPAQKLALWNTGPGMDDRQLVAMTDIASSIGKQLGLDDNFGMGAKVASLPSNQYGLRYRSCKGGRVHEVLLGKREGIYGRILRHDPDTGRNLEVIEVTDIVREEGEYPLDQDWTEVVLLGNRPDQDTAADPYDGSPKVPVQWLADYLYFRFYRVPSDIVVTMEQGTHKLDRTRTFKTIDRRRAEDTFPRHETVEAEGGLRIHYVYDPPYVHSQHHNQSISGSITTSVSACAVVYKEEMYDVRMKKQWAQDAPIFGITFGGRHISVHVELPTTAAVRPDGYREFLRWQGGGQERVLATDFAEMVSRHRPQWLIDIIRQHSPEGASTDEIRVELQRLLNELSISRQGPRPSPSGDEPAGEDAGGAGVAARPGGGNGNGGRREPGTAKPPEPADLSALPQGAKRAGIYENIDRAPEIFKLTSEEEIENKNIRGRAARYYPEANQLFVNMTYPAISEMQAVLEVEYAAAADPDAMRTIAREQAEHDMIVRIGRGVIFALAKNLNLEWDREAVERALSTESLSTKADDYWPDLQDARRLMGRRLRTSRTEAVLAAD